MRRAFMPTQKVITTYLKDMKLIAHVEFGDLGACRRR